MVNYPIQEQCVKFGTQINPKHAGIVLEGTTGPRGGL